MTSRPCRWDTPTTSFLPHHLRFAEPHLAQLTARSPLTRVPSPSQVLVTRERKSVASFLTQLCAILGGVFTVTGIVDGMIYHGSATLKRKMQVGKLI